MQQSWFQIFVLPQVAAGEPIAVAVASQVPCRVVVKNLSGATVNLGFASQDVQGPDGVGSAIWQLPPADTDIFVLAPRQRLFANASAPNSRITVHMSEALPLHEAAI